jgi:hypothetical protein
MLALLLAATAAQAQTPGEKYVDRTSGRRVQVVAVDSARVYYVGLDTSSVLKTSFARSYAPAAVMPPPTDPAPAPVPTDPGAVFAEHDFNDGTLGPFTTLAGEASSSFVQPANGRVEILYERLDTASSGDRNKGIKWLPADGSQNTPFGATLYIGGTWTIPSLTPAARAKIDAAAARLGLPPQTDTAQMLLQRKLIYINAGTTNHAVLKIHGLSLVFVPSVGDFAPCSTTRHAQPVGVKRFTAAELFDKPQRIELEIKRSSGVRVADGEAKVWVNGVLAKHITGFCTNENTNTKWTVQIGQQVSYTKGKADLFSELRVLDDVIIGRTRPF